MARRIVELDKTFTMNGDVHKLQIKFAVQFGSEESPDDLIGADYYVHHCQNSVGNEVDINGSVIPELLVTTWEDLEDEAIDRCYEIMDEEDEMFHRRQMERIELEERIGDTDMD